MYIYKKMNAEEFADFVIGLKEGELVNFATNYIGDEDFPLVRDHLEFSDLEAWYFVKHMFIDGYDSRFLLLDYSGGECAFAIPLNGYGDQDDEYNRYYVRKGIKEFFNKTDDIDSVVYVEIEVNE